MKQPKKNKKRLEKLRNKYRLVILNDETFEEKASLRLSRLNVIAVGGSIFLLLILITTSIIVFTPIREFIPGYTDVNLRKNLITLTLKADSLEKQMLIKDKYITTLQRIIKGEPPADEIPQPKDSTIDIKNINLGISEKDSALRAKIEQEEKYNLITSNTKFSSTGLSSFFFFAPIKGTITGEFDPQTKHYGIDVVAPKNEPISATLDGTVIFADWTTETGYTIIIQHQNNLISVYKHNSVLLKNEGDIVQAGEVIAILGNSGEITTGPHLHFELWYNGYPIDPKEYIIF
jgi:murein DD-endopeptidase MepM/ murein hydrolase activator NlpD